MAEIRVQFDEVRDQIKRLFASLHNLASELPPLPDSHVCDCGVDDDWALAQDGYGAVYQLQWCTEDDDDPHWHAFTDGWDDMSDDGDGPLVAQCRSCYTFYKVPDDDVPFD